MRNAALTPSPRIKNYREHSGANLSSDELQRVFSGSATHLRRLVDVARLAATHAPPNPAQQHTPVAAGARAKAARNA